MLVVDAARAACAACAAGALVAPVAPAASVPFVASARRCSTTPCVASAFVVPTDLRSGSVASQGAPLRIQVRTCSSKVALSSGGSARPGPGFQPQATRWSVTMCCSSIASERWPLVPGSRKTLHSAAPCRPTQFIFMVAGGMCQPGLPSVSSPGGACGSGLFCVEWQVVHCSGATPLPSGPRCTGG
ncbi:hypothetical protein ACQ86G_12595 [Roseateles chitinivorans]|uniref:hypothetical protein n=1 Tax=Roseateles chitinivorans TaxID=2917965 RepID=UPI003D66F955